MKILKKTFISISVLLLFVVSVFIVNPYSINALNSSYGYSATSSDATKITTSSYTYDENWFKDDGYSYNHELAKFLLRMSIVAGGTGDNPASNLKDTYASLGYKYVDSIKLDDLDYMNNTDSIIYMDPSSYFDYQDDSKDTIGFGIAYKNIKFDEEHIYTIISVAIRGSGYETEWASNFTIGTQNDHKGFSDAANVIKNKLVDYILKINTDYPIKIWTTGYSRGGACSNLLGHYLDLAAKNKEINVLPENIYCYGFEVPQGAYNPTNIEYTYSYHRVYLDDNIYSIVNTMDLIPLVAMNSLGFYHYGNVINLPNTISTVNYYNTEIYSQMIKEYNKLLGTNEDSGACLSDVAFMQNQNASFRNILYVLSDVFNDSRQLYVSSNAEEALRVLINCFMNWDEEITKVNIRYKTKLTGINWNVPIDVAGLVEGKFNLTEIYGILMMLAIESRDGYDIDIYTTNNSGKVPEYVTIHLTENQFQKIVDYGWDLYYLYKDNKLNIDGIGDGIPHGHYMELCEAWMKAIDYEDIKDSKSYHLITMSLDGKATVYYGENVVALVSDSETSKDYKDLEAYLRDDGKILIRVPNKDGYKIKIEFDNSSTFSLDVETKNINTNQTLARNKYNTPNASGIYVLNLNENNVSLLNNDSYSISPTVSEKYADYSDVILTLTCDTDKGSVSGEGTYDRLEYATVSASEGDDYDFVSWNLNNNVISGEKDFRYRNDYSSTLEAIFELSYKKVLKNHVSIGDIDFFDDDGFGFEVNYEIDEYQDEITLHYQIKDDVFNIEPNDSNFLINMDLNDLDEEIDIWASIMDGEDTINSEHTKIKLSDYYQELDEEEKEDTPLGKLVDSLLTYQDYLEKYNDDAKDEPLINIVSEEDIKEEAYKINNMSGINKIKLDDISLIIGDNIGLKIYYSISSGYSKDSFTFLIDGEDAPNSENIIVDNNFLIIKNINGEDLDKQFNIVVKENDTELLNFNYSVMSYVYEVLRMKDPSYNNLKNLVSSIYAYSEAIDAYHIEP